jgi:hypothetical protein
MSRAIRDVPRKEVSNVIVRKHQPHYCSTTLPRHAQMGKLNRYIRTARSLMEPTVVNFVIDHTHTFGSIGHLEYLIPANALQPKHP